MTCPICDSGTPCYEDEEIEEIAKEIVSHHKRLARMIQELMQ